MNKKKKKNIVYHTAQTTKLKLATIVPRMMRVQYDLPVVDLGGLVEPKVDVVPPILEDIFLPPYQGSSGHDDYVPLMTIAKSLQPQIVFEIGTAFGNLTANICRQCPDAKVYTVNAPIEDQTGRRVTLKLTREDIGRVYRAHGFADHVVQIFKNSLELDLSDYFEGPVIDLAIIDGCHDTEYVINDFFKVQPYMCPRGVVLFHDSNPNVERQLINSYMACMMLRRKGYEIRHLRNTWWAVWVNPDYVVPLQQM